jgi:hypothetical protein
MCFNEAMIQAASKISSSLLIVSIYNDKWLCKVAADDYIMQMIFLCKRLLPVYFL